MNNKTLLASLVLLGCLSDVSLVTEAAETVRAQRTDSEPLAAGDKVPDQYGRSDTELKDWKKRGLGAPGPGTQWVQINGDYVLVNRSNATVVQTQEGVK